MNHLDVNKVKVIGALILIENVSRIYTEEQWLKLHEVVEFLFEPVLRHVRRHNRVGDAIFEMIS